MTPAEREALTKLSILVSDAAALLGEARDSGLNTGTLHATGRAWMIDAARELCTLFLDGARAELRMHKAYEGFSRAMLNFERSELQREQAEALISAQRAAEHPHVREDAREFA